MKVIVCDRCGIQVMTSIQVMVGSSDIVYDFCSNCRDQFKRWIEDGVVRAAPKNRDRERLNLSSRETD